MIVRTHSTRQKAMSIKIKTAQTSKQFTLMSGILAFCLWGGWAYYINHQPETYIGLVSGITQGTASFIITLVMVNVVTFLFQRIKSRLLRPVLPAAITVSFTSVCLATIHTLMGTPNIPHTIIPPLTVAFLFCVFVGYKLQHAAMTNEIQP